LICAAAGALPETTRDFRTVIAASPAPPATAKSFQVWPLACIDAFNSATALASPPDVHQCSTSTSPACASVAPISPAAASATEIRVIVIPVSLSGIVFKTMFKNCSAC